MYDRITQLEIELTSRCNAACPQCSRNYYGGKTWPTLPIKDLSLSFIKKSLASIIVDIEHVRLCGTYGDPCVHPRLIEIVQWLVESSNAAITINTNGGMRKPEWWQRLAQVLSQRGKIYFGIDGLSDTHALYRRNTDFERVILNAQAFNRAGGQSVWSFLVFEHNQHQVELARQMSQHYGFADFVVKSTSRFVNKAHELIDQQPVVDRQGKTIYWLRPTTDLAYKNQGYENVSHIIAHHGSYQNYLKQVNISCKAKNTGLVTISSEGLIFPCGWLADRLYGYEVEQPHSDRQQFLDLIDQHGGLAAIDLHHQSFDDIVNGAVFAAIQCSWTADNRLTRCANQCGTQNTLLSTANKELQKVWSGKKFTEA
jgi:MoaA/NifB/PqqE/SkfB family radical SAM enzyme